MRTAIAVRTAQLNRDSRNNRNLTNNNVPLLDLVHEASEHGLHIETVVVSEAEFVEIGL